MHIYIHLNIWMNLGVAYVYMILGWLLGIEYQLLGHSCESLIFTLSSH